MGCLSRVGCLVVLAGAGAVGWWLYGERLPSELAQVAGRATKKASQVADRLTTDSATRSPRAAGDSVRRRATPNADDGIIWSSIDPRAGTDALAPLSAARGPAFVSVNAADLAAILAVPLSTQLPRTASNLQIALDGKQLLVRGLLDVGEIAGDGTLGRVLGIALTGRDSIRLAGSLEPLKPGFAQLHIESLRVKGFDVPPRLIPAVMRVLRRTKVDSTLADDALAVRLPRSIADLRVQNSRMILYKTVPAP